MNRIATVVHMVHMNMTHTYQVLQGNTKALVREKMDLCRPLLGKKDDVGLASKAYTQNTRKSNSTRASRFYYYQEQQKRDLQRQRTDY